MVFPYLLIPMKDIIYYYLLIRYYIIWTLFFVIEIPYYDFVICDLCDCLRPLSICKDTKYNQKCKILNV